MYSMICLTAALMIAFIYWQFEKGRYNDVVYAENIKKSADEARAANAAKTSFLSRMTHDIRTPLNGIIGLLNIDENHPDDAELIKANRAKMLVAANHLLSLINDVLQMSKLESGEIVLAHEPISLIELANDINTLMEQRATEAGVDIEYDKDESKIKYPYVYASPLHIRQIFLNIYGNCIKYNKSNGRVETRFSFLGVKDNVVTYKWIISDTGIGMSKDFLKHIFEPFAQERTDARSIYNGTGLGMAIVKELIDKMNGTIEVTSIEGEGSTFTITIPFEIADKEQFLQKTKLNKNVDIKGLKLLLVEDNELNAEIAETLLGDEGAVITAVSDGRQAVDNFKSNPPGTYDAILMDVMMPVMDGITATKIIRAMDRPDAKEIPILAMTANAFDEDAKSCIDAGMNAHLAKPLQMDVVVATIDMYCRKNK
ncbi:hybrid sensor histidine kinase/response regulator [Anaerotignum sp. MSJ-24]|uniref:hybrid sensor histidine kinase/response regulator n=1 Tax=Anaerotignum sp. MSJ-24 TaxID=2841521 RepID=UPI001C10DAE6|nr:ATP-binding protein [Anaerotignum sp. MSJ-24]MBU5463312.1 response regulator [Anaerotignum sp. MSJ-24]